MGGRVDHVDAACIHILSQLENAVEPGFE